LLLLLLLPLLPLPLLLPLLGRHGTVGVCSLASRVRAPHGRHGGVFDRVDCQLITGLATQTYYATFIGPSAILSVKRVLQLAASLAADDQLQLYKQLGQSLKTQGLLR
jgi:hypothetical protein